MKFYIKQWLAVALLIALAVSGCKDDDQAEGFKNPDVMEISPEEALIGESVTVTGENFKNVISVKFGSVDADFTITDDNQILTTVPDGLNEGDAGITVFYKGAAENNLGPSDKIDFVVLYEPVLNSVSPTAAKPGFEVTLAGDFLKRATSLKFGEIEMPFDVTQNEIVTEVPIDAVVGETQIMVTTPGGVATIPFTISERTPEIYSFAPASGGKTGEEVTITGLFFMDVQSVKIGTTNVPVFDVVSETEIQLTIPAGASSNKVTVKTALGEVVSEGTLNVIEIPFVLYGEDLHSQMQNWGWGGSDVFNSTAVAKSGTKSYLRTYNDAWSGIQLHHGTLNLSPYSAVKFSVYGGPGTTGKILNFTCNWGTMVPITLTAGAWTDYTIPLSQIGNPGVLDNLIFQEKGDTAPAVSFSVYLDNIMFVE